MKTLVVVILGLFALTNILGQDFKKFDYQFDLGTTITVPYKKTIEIWPEFNDPSQTDYHSNFGYFLEFIVSYNITKKIAISSGLNYNYVNLKIDDKIALNENKGDLTSSYLDLPILVTYRLSDKIPLSISAGPYFGMIISANEKGTSYFDTARLVFASGIDPAVQSINPVQKYNRDIKKDYTAFDIGLSAQIDYELKLSEKFKGVIFTRFNYGLKDVLTNDLANYSNASDWKNYTLMIGLGIKL